MTHKVEVYLSGQEITVNLLGYTATVRRNEYGQAVISNASMPTNIKDPNWTKFCDFLDFYLQDLNK